MPQIVPFDFGEDEINAMDMVSASCTVNKGDLPMKITWTRNNQSIYTNDGVSISRTNQRISILSIESVRDRHSGDYTCMYSILTLFGLDFIKLKLFDIFGTISICEVKLISEN